MSFRSLILLLGLCAFVPLYVPACATTTAVEKEAKPGDLDRLRAVGSKVGGLIVWTSSREGGIPHLFTIKTDGSGLQQLTKGQHTDWYPRFSPDGTKVLFSRSRAKGFVRQSSANDPGAWDLYTVNADGNDLKKVAVDGAWGSWISAEEILFVRGGIVVRAKVDGSEEAEVVDTSAEGVLGGATIRQPQLSPDGKYLALTLAGTRRQVGIWKVKKKVWNDVGSGAQATWTPDGAAIVWISPTGKDLAQISRIAVEKGVPVKDGDQAHTWALDVTGKRSREAFPRLSNDGKWLVFGAAITSLESDLEDYELYLWEVGSPPETSARLTFNTANDSWPDVFTGAPSAKAVDEEAAEKTEAPPEGEAGEDAKADKAAAEKEKVAPEEAAVPAAADAGAEEPAADEAAPFKAKGKGKKPAPKAKKKHR